MADPGTTPHVDGAVDGAADPVHLRSGSVATSDAPRPATADLDAELAGLDALDTAAGPRMELGTRIWAATWPKLVALAIVIGIWQLLFVLKVKEPWVLPAPSTVFSELRRLLESTDTAPGFGGVIGAALVNTMQRAVVGFSLAMVIGVVIGAVVSRVKPLRVAVGSLLTSLQTMPSIAWFPFSILLFKLSEAAILFVVVLGAAPAIANGLIGGTDQVPPLLVRAGKVLGAKGWTLYRNVVLPATLPNFVSGLKQGWAFAWRSLLAGELLVIIENKPSLGFQLNLGRELNDAPLLMAVMIVILIIGLGVDAGFGAIERGLLRRRGLGGT